MGSEENDGFLAVDGPFMHVMDLVINMLLLNLLVIICSLPLFTVGAAFTAMHHQLYRMSKNMDGYIIRGFFKDFKSNFKVSTITWLIALVIGAFLAVDLKIFWDGVSFPAAFKWAIISFCVIYLYGLVYLFPVLARYDTTPQKALKYSLVMAFHKTGVVKTLFMIALYIAPWLIAMNVANFVLAILLFGISLPAYINVFLYRKTFEEFEKKEDPKEDKSAEENL